MKGINNPTNARGITPKCTWRDSNSWSHHTENKSTITISLLEPIATWKGINNPTKYKGNYAHMHVNRFEIQNEMQLFWPTELALVVISNHRSKCNVTHFVIIKDWVSVLSIRHRYDVNSHLFHVKIYFDYNVRTSKKMLLLEPLNSRMVILCYLTLPLFGYFAGM